MTYREALTSAMRALATEPRVRFVGYGVRYGGQAAGTLAGIPEEQLIETPVAENLMVSLALGLSLVGLVPVVYLERMDFILNALDAIVNHVNALERISQGEFKAGVILRVVVGNKTKPLFTGLTHTQNFTDAIRAMVDFSVMTIEWEQDNGWAGLVYRMALERALEGKPTMLVEYKDLI